MLVPAVPTVKVSDRTCSSCNRPIVVVDGKLGEFCAGCGANAHNLWLDAHQTTIKVCPEGHIAGGLPEWAEFCPKCKARLVVKKELTEPDPWVYDYGKMPPVFRAKLAGDEE